MGPLLECGKCGWVHFGVTEAYVVQWEKEWAERWLTMSEESRDNYGCKDAPPKRDQYEHCFRCGWSYKDMRPTERDMNGHTIQPILMEV